MRKGRVEAFTDGVLAVIITIMVLELHAPHSAEFSALLEEAPTFLSYVLSFVYVAIYWNNHHHMFQEVDRIDGSILWANNFLLFCLSLIPFSTDWMGENHFQSVPVAVYGATLILPGTAYAILEARIISFQGPHSRLRAAVGNRWKEYASLVGYVLGVALAFVVPVISEILYCAVALIWFIPDRRIERHLEATRSPEGGDAED
jgi:uncharacterized membrane protein